MRNYWGGNSAGRCFVLYPATFLFKKKKEKSCGLGSLASIKELFTGTVAARHRNPIVACLFGDSPCVMKVKVALDKVRNIDMT